MPLLGVDLLSLLMSANKALCWKRFLMLSGVLVATCAAAATFLLQLAASHM
jgi:hypothetical protein